MPPTDSSGDELASSVEQLSQQARAHALEAALTTMEAFVDQEDMHVFVMMREPTFRAPHDEGRTFDEAILELEPTRYILLTRTVNSSVATSPVIVFYEGQVGGEKGYGVLHTAKSTPTIETFDSPQAILSAYGDEAILSAARFINERNLELDITKYL